MRDFFVSNTSRENAGAVGIDFSGINLSRVESIVVVDVETGFLLEGSPRQAYYNVFSLAEAARTVHAFVLREDANSNAFYFPRTNNNTGTVFKIDGSSDVGIHGGAIEGFPGRIGIDLSAEAAVSGVYIYGVRLQLGGTGIRIGPGSLRVFVGGLLPTSLTTAVDLEPQVAPENVVVLAPGDFPSPSLYPGFPG